MAVCAKIPVGIVKKIGNLNLIHKESLDDAASIGMPGPGVHILLKDVYEEEGALLPEDLGGLLQNVIPMGKLRAWSSILSRKPGSWWDRNFWTTQYP